MRIDVCVKVMAAVLHFDRSHRWANPVAGCNWLESLEIRRWPGTCNGGCMAPGEPLELTLAFLSRTVP